MNIYTYRPMLLLSFRPWLFVHLVSSLVYKCRQKEKKGQGAGGTIGEREIRDNTCPKPQLDITLSASQLTNTRQQQLKLFVISCPIFKQFVEFTICINYDDVAYLGIRNKDRRIWLLFLLFSILFGTEYK